MNRTTLLVVAIVLVLLGLLVLGAALIGDGGFTWTDICPWCGQRLDGGDRDGGVDGDGVTPPGGRRGPRSMPPSDDFTDQFDSLGEQVYFTGVGEDGLIPRTVPFGPGMMGGVSCASCHGDDGTGREFFMMGRTWEAPDIRYDTLTSEHVEGGETHEPWSDDDIARAVREGIEPDGEELDVLMPRWDMTDAEMDATIDHLEELSQ
ncbi:MAG: cytochrome c [Anaerosomatales bacterium]|nr:cytochrome c [Anaerosomatales bacterium]